MMSLHLRTRLLSLFLFSSGIYAQDDNPCQSFGVDFQDQGSYFQNSNSSDPFTFVSQFTGCQADTCFNVLVDPSGNSVECSDTQLTPDDSSQLSTCPTLKDQMVSGPWSVILISNNGDAEPIAYERDFSLSVGPQQTTTITPTITVPVTSVSIVNITSTVIDVNSNTTLLASTVYAASTTIVVTKTVVPNRVTSTTTKTVATVTSGKPSVQVVKSTIVVTPTCTVPPRQPTSDPKLHFKLPSLNGPHAAQIQSIIAQAALSSAASFGSSGSSKSARNSKNSRGLHVKGRKVVFDKEEFLQARNERMAVTNVQLAKRAPDEPIVTVNATNTAAYPTVTSTTLITSTAVIAVTIETTATITPPAVTVISGKATGPAVTVTAPTPTRLITQYTVATITQQKVITTTVIITSITTPAASATACRNRGGHFMPWM